MFLNNKTSGYNRHGEQVASGDFLMIFSDPTSKASKPELRCIVRFTRFSQCGNWMMGSAQVGPHRFVLSGTYGSDGLPINLVQKQVSAKERGTLRQLTPTEQVNLWNKLQPIPQELQTAFWLGGGHNTGGSEMPHFRQWACLQLKQLKKLRKAVDLPEPPTPEEEAKILANKRRIKNTEIGSEQAYCPKCGHNGGEFRGTPEGDYLTCSFCQYDAPALVFLREARRLHPNVQCHPLSGHTNFYELLD